eukprot:15602_1
MASIQSSTDYSQLNPGPPSLNEQDEEKGPLRGASFWNDEHAFVDNDFEPSCPFIAENCPYPCCCLCTLSRSQRQQCAMSMLYSKAYLVIYLLIIAMTLLLLIYDLAHGNIVRDIKEEPIWFILVDITCVALMLFDVIVQIIAHPASYWKSATNVFDFMVVILCVVSIPIYFYIPDSDFIVTVVLLLRFAARLLRIVMVYKHHENRSAFMETTRADVVDFTGLDAPNDINNAQGRSQASTYQNPTIQNGSYQNGADIVESNTSPHFNPSWDDI